jgi:Uncharacterised nucleotidyltransferase
MNDPHTAPGTRPGRAPELDLLLVCARWPQKAADRECIRLQSANVLDWQRFSLLAQHHRLVPLVWHNLHASIGAEATPKQQPVFDELRQLASANAFRALRSLAELRRVVQEFQTHNISVRVLKGIPLAQSVFGDLSLRATGDLDLLIDEDSILEADCVLRGFGYKGLFQVDHFTPRRLAFYRTHWKDLAYDNPATGFEVDLHWRCFRNSEMPGAALRDTPATETLSFGSFQVTTLPPAETLLYLCVHGTLDGWLYLKSLADVGAQVRTMDPAQLDALAELAASYGILPELSAALILARRYFGMDHWSARLLGEGDPTVEHILRFAGKALEQGGFLSSRDAIPAGSMMAFEIGLRRNFRYRMELLLRVLFRARMWETIPLPDFLFLVYPLLSPFEWLAFRLRQWLTKPPSNAALSI